MNFEVPHFQYFADIARIVKASLVHALEQKTIKPDVFFSGVPPIKETPIAWVEWSIRNLDLDLPSSFTFAKGSTIYIVADGNCRYLGRECEMRDFLRRSANAVAPVLKDKDSVLREVAAGNLDGELFGAFHDRVVRLAKGVLA